MSRERLYRSIRTEGQAVRLARKQGFSDKIIEHNAGGWKDHYVNTGETLRQIAIYEKALSGKLSTKGRAEQ